MYMQSVPGDRSFYSLLGILIFLFNTSSAKYEKVLPYFIQTPFAMLI